MKLFKFKMTPETRDTICLYNPLKFYLLHIMTWTLQCSEWCSDVLLWSSVLCSGRGGGGGGTWSVNKMSGLYQRDLCLHSRINRLILSTKYLWNSDWLHLTANHCENYRNEDNEGGRGNPLWWSEVWQWGRVRTWYPTWLTRRD